MSKNGHPNGNGHVKPVVTGSPRIVATAAPTANVEKAELTINTPEALAALQNAEILQRQDNKVNLLKKALDGYQSLTTNFGPTDFVRGAAFNFLLDGPKDIDAECGYPPWLIPQQYNYMFDREPIANRVVTCLPEETWAEDPEIWEDDDPDKQTPFEEMWAALEEQHNLFSMLQRADVLSGIGQFGIILIGIDDGKDLREPVDGIFDDGTVDPEQEHKLLYLRVFSEVVVFVKVREIDITSPRYSQPKIYTIQFRDYPNWGVQAGEIIARDIHWTRVIHLADNRKESEVYGVPRMQPVYNRLYDLRKIYSSSGEGYWKGAFPGLAFEVNPEAAAQGIELDVKSLREEMERFQNGLQRYLALTGVTTKSLPATMMEPGGCVETQLRAIAICLGIPERILWGSEEAVLAGNQDSRAWNKRLGKRQTKYVNPLIIRPFINRLIAMGILPPPKDCMQPVEGEGTFIITGGYQIEWPDLNAPTDMDKAQVAAAETSAMAAYVQGGVSQLMAPREYLTHVLGYSVDEADAILEASMEFSGDEEEPLSAASQMAQEQEAAEQEHDQALELQDAKGAKGENTKPERNSVGPVVNNDFSNSILHNPSKSELQALLDTVTHEHGRYNQQHDLVLRGVVGENGDHNWGSAHIYEHTALAKGKYDGRFIKPLGAGSNTSPPVGKVKHELYVKGSGHIVVARGDMPPHEVPGIGSKLQPAKRVVANTDKPHEVPGIGNLQPPKFNDSAGMESNTSWQNGWKVAPEQSKSERQARQILTNPSREELQGLLDHVHQHNQDNSISYSPLKIVLRGVSNDDGTKHNWGSSYFHEHRDLKQGDHSLDNHLYVATTGHIAKMGRMGGFEPFNVPAIGPKLGKVSAERVGMKTNAEYGIKKILVNPSKERLQGHFDSIRERHRDQIAGMEPFETVMRGLVSEDGSHHVWGDAWQYDHGHLFARHQKPPTVSLTVGPNGKITRTDSEYEAHEVPGIGSQLASMKGFATNAELLHQQVLTNPSRPDLQALFDTVHHRLEAAQALGSDDVVLRGVISRGGDKHVWGNAFQYEHGDLKDKSGDSDIAKGSHLYIHPSGKIFKFGKGYREDEYNVPGIGSKLNPPQTKTTASGLQWGNREEEMAHNKARPRDMLHDQDQNLNPPQEDQPKPYAEVENLPGDPDQDDEEQREEGGLGGANPDNGDALATPNLSREGVKKPVDPEMIQLPTLNVDGGTEFRSYKVIDGDTEQEQS